MGLFYRLLGLVAALNAVLDSIRIFHWVRLNWIVLAVLVWHSYDAAGQWAEARPAGALAPERVLPLVRMVLSTSAVVLFVICLTRGNLIFHTAALPRGKESRGPADGQGRRRDFDLRISGKVRRGSGALALRDFPVDLDVAENGEIALVAWVKIVGQSSSVYSMIEEDRSGKWSIALTREALKGDLEGGVLYFGLSARPALHLTFPEKHEDFFLSFPNATALEEFLGTLDEVIAESTRREAIFARRLTEVASHPPPAKEPEGDVKWNDLIDFSK